MPRPNSYGSRANRERRQQVAAENAQKPQIQHQVCATKHREGRPCQG